MGSACVFCWPVFLGRVMLPADMCLLMLPWRALAGQFDFDRAYNPMFDPIQQYLPWRIYAVASLRSGFIPLWNPYAFCGTPFLANLQSAILYPPNLLFLITGARHGFGASAIFHLILGGVFTYAFLLTFGLRRPAALLGALVVMFNCYTVTWLEYPTLSLWVFMWLPGILLCYERSLRRPRSHWPMLTALGVGLQFLGGHLQISVYVLIALAIYVVVRLVSRPSKAVRPILMLTLALALGFGLAAAQILPTLELASHTGRVAHGAQEATSTAFPITHFVLYLMPNFFGNPVHYNYWGNFRDPGAINFFETACYVGVVPLFFAAWSLRRWRERHFWFWAALTVFAFLTAAGSPVYLLLYHFAPGFRELAGLGRVLCLAGFGLAGLAAIGMDDLLAQAESQSVRVLLTFTAIAIAAALLVWSFFQPLITLLEPEWRFGEYHVRQLVVFLCLCAAACALLTFRARARLPAALFSPLALAILMLDLFGFGIRFNPFMPAEMAYPETGSIRWLREHAGHYRFTSLASRGLDWMPHNASMVFGLRDIHGSDSLRIGHSYKLVNAPGKVQADYPDPSSPLMTELGVRYLMTRRELTDPWRLVHNVEAPIYENSRSLPRAYLESRNAPGLTVTAGPEAGRKQEGEELYNRHRGLVAFARDDPNAITLEVQAGQEGKLVLTDSYYPGWRAWVDSKPAPISIAKGAFRGILLPEGQHSVELRYAPASFAVGLFISLVALAVVAGTIGALLLAGRASTLATAARS